MEHPLTSQTTKSYIKNMEEMLNLSINAEWYESIENHFLALQRSGEKIMQMSLPKHTESAMTYQLPDLTAK